MHSRAFMLLRRDLVNLQRFPIAGVTAAPTHSDSLFHWSARIEGLRGTVWEGGIFQVTLAFSDMFNTQPPQVQFMTIPFHPNIDPQRGTPSCHLLGEGGWSEDCTVSSVLLALQALLGSPEVDGGCVLNVEAARLLWTAPHTYRQMALDCVTASLRIDAGLPAYEASDHQTEPQPVGLDRPSSTPGKRLGSSRRERRRQTTKPISFDDYHTLWKGIATSVTTYRQPNMFSKLLDQDIPLRTAHHPVTGDEMSADVEKQRKTLSYGGLGGRKRVKANHINRLQRIEALKQLYRSATLPQQDGGLTGAADGGLTGAADGSTGGEDVEDLIQWTKSLDEQELNT